jgi:hypothetical protein
MRVESKSTQAVRALARRLLVLDGEKLPPTDELAEQAGVGIGTVAKALEFLRQEGALHVRRTQRSGTTVERLDHGHLWNHAAYGPVRGGLPIQLDISLDAVAVALTEALDAVGVQASLTHRAGAVRRVEAIKAGEFGFTVISRHTLDRVHGVKTVCQFGPGSYYGTTGIYRLLARDGRRIERVGGYSDSPDHYDLVQAEFPEATIVDVPFRAIPHLILDGRVDATVWYGGAPIPGALINGLKTETARSKASEELASTPAVVVVAQRSPLYNLLQHLDRDLLERTYSVTVQSFSGAAHA